MPDLADQLDEALSELRRGESAALDRLIASMDESAPFDDGHAQNGSSSVGSLGSLIHSVSTRMSVPAIGDCPNIANFEILQELGRGGMGVVYEAVQLHPRRTVALKLMRPGRETDAYHRMLFEREILALASLEHPNIASLHHASTTDDGRSFFVMELVRGLPINEFADHHKLDLRGRLELFSQLCDGVHHAHLRGVIHRDLKPSNVLVIDKAEEGSSASTTAAAGRVKIMDFGLARLVSDEHAAANQVSQTLDADRIKGTLAFMSPEQLQGERTAIDGRTDVYALGVMLFQLLTGQLPLDPAGRSIAQLIQATQENDPPRISSVQASLRGDLDVIAQTAMAHDRERRYQSAAQLGDDIRRFLRNEPIFARPATALYHIRLFARRNKSLVVATCAVLLALVIGFAAATIALMQVNAAQEETTKARHTADQINRFLNEMLASADPNVTRGRDVTVVAMLDEASRKLDEGALAGQEAAETDVRMTIADAYLSLGFYPQAEAQCERAVKQRERLYGKTDHAVADSLLKLAFVQTRQEQFDEAHASVDEALRIRTAIDGANSLSAARALIARAEVWIRMSRNDDARPILCDLLPRVIELTGGEENDDVAIVKGRLGFCHGCADSDDDGIRLLEEVRATETRLFGAGHERLARTLINLGVLHMHKRDRKLAESLMTEALNIRKRVYGDDHPATATALFNLASCYYGQKRYAEAEAALRQTLAVQERRLVPGHYEIGRSRHYLAVCLLRQNRCEEAEPEFRRTIEELRDQPSTHQANRASNAQAEFADCLVSQGRFEEAERELIEAIQRSEQHYGPAESVRRHGARFVRLYEAWGKGDQLAAWRARVDSQQEPSLEPTDLPGGS